MGGLAVSELFDRIGRLDGKVEHFLRDVFYLAVAVENLLRDVLRKKESLIS